MFAIICLQYLFRHIIVPPKSIPLFSMQLLLWFVCFCSIFQFGSVAVYSSGRLSVKKMYGSILLFINLGLGSLVSYLELFAFASLNITESAPSGLIVFHFACCCGNYRKPEC